MKYKSLILSAIFCACAFAAIAQNDIQIGQITSINLGDGRILFRELESEKPLNGRHRLIDGYRSEYILANFKDGLYDGTYEHYKNNALTEKGAYKEGVKNGTFTEYFSDGQRVKSERHITDGKIDGIVKSYYTDGSLEKEKGYKQGKEHGPERYFEFGAKEPKIDHNYFEGVMDGKQVTHMTGSGDYDEVKYFDKGVRVGEFLQTWADGSVKQKGSYKDGKMNGVWVEGRKDGKLESEISYRDDKRHGESKTFFTDGSTEKITRYADDKRNGVELTFRYDNGKLASEYTWADGIMEGEYKIYDPDGSLREEGMYERGNDIYRKTYYSDGQLKEIRRRRSGGGPWETLESYDSDGTRR